MDHLWHPAIGALGLGILGFFVPRILGVGYDVISDVLNNRLAFSLLLLIMVFKAAALIISLGSGTSGGLLAPMFMSSAAMGAVYAIVVNHILPGANLAPGAFALVAMGAVFGAAARSTFAFIIFAFEITRDYNAVLPLMLVGVIADGIALTLLRHSMMIEKLARRGLHVVQEYETDPLSRVTVGAVMDQNPPTIPAGMTVAELANRIAQSDPDLTRHQGLPILDDQGRLAGIITRADILRFLNEDPSGGKTVLEVGEDALVVAYPDETAADAAAKMLRNNVGRLPVVNRGDPYRLVGYVGRPNVMAARMRALEEEYVREEGWLSRLPSSIKKQTRKSRLHSSDLSRQDVRTARHSFWRW